MSSTVASHIFVVVVLLPSTIGAMIMMVMVRLKVYKNYQYQLKLILFSLLNYTSSRYIFI